MSMRTIPRSVLAGALLVLGLAASPASAAMIDFRDAAFAPAYGLSSYATTVGGLEVTVRALPAPGAALYHDATDGLGIGYGYEADEIEGAEVLEIRFARDVSIAALQLTDLFNEHGYLETGSYSVDGGAPVGFAALADQTLGSTNGERTLAVGAVGRTIRLFAPGRIGSQGHEFSLGGIEAGVIPTPEPGAAVLFWTGALVVGSALRRRI